MFDDDMKKIFSKNLCRLMVLKDKVQTDIVRDLNLRQATVSDWTKGKSYPRMNKAALLAQYFDVDVTDLVGEHVLDLAKEKQYAEKEHSPPVVKILSSAYLKAPPRQKDTVKLLLEPYKDSVIHVGFKYYVYNKASAGTGFLLNDETAETIKVRLDALPKGYELDPSRYCGVTVSGDSMEPDYKDGDILIIKDTAVNMGEIGLVMMNGEGYVKQIGAHVLKSLNPKYNDIPMEWGMKFCGKVVGVLDPKAIKE